MAVLHTGLAIMAGWVARVAGATVATRRVWGAVSFAGVAYAVGGAVQLVVILVSPMSLEVAQGGTFQAWAVLLGTVTLVVVALTSPTGLASHRERTRFWLDVSIVMAAATTFGGYTYLPTSLDVAAVLLSLLTGPGVFPVGVFAVVRLVLSAQPPFSRLAGLTLAAAATVEGVAQASGRLMTDMGRLSWLLGITVIASAVLTGSGRLQQLQLRADASILHPRPRRPFSTLPYVAIAATNLLLLWALAKIGLNEHVWVVIVGAITSTALVVARQLVAITDNSHLLDELDAKVQELNQSLSERDHLATKLRHEAFHDPMTGLPNWAMFNDRLRDGLGAVGRHRPADADDHRPRRLQAGERPVSDMPRATSFWSQRPGDYATACARSILSPGSVVMSSRSSSRTCRRTPTRSRRASSKRSPSLSRAPTGRPPWVPASASSWPTAAPGAPNSSSMMPIPRCTCRRAQARAGTASSRSPASPPMAALGQRASGDLGG